LPAQIKRVASVLFTIICVYLHETLLKIFYFVVSLALFFKSKWRGEKYRLM
jgi:hypothetical protein